MVGEAEMGRAAAATPYRPPPLLCVWHSRRACDAGSWRFMPLPGSPPGGRRRCLCRAGRWSRLAHAATRPFHFPRCPADEPWTAVAPWVPSSATTPSATLPHHPPARSCTRSPALLLPRLSARAAPTNAASGGGDGGGRPALLRRGPARRPTPPPPLPWCLFLVAAGKRPPAPHARGNDGGHHGVPLHLSGHSSQRGVHRGGRPRCCGAVLAGSLGAGGGWVRGRAAVSRPFPPRWAPPPPLSDPLSPRVGFRPFPPAGRAFCRCCACRLPHCYRLRDRGPWRGQSRRGCDVAGVAANTLVPSLREFPDTGDGLATWADEVVGGTS